MITTGYHYHGEKRKRRDNERQWRASFPRWVKEEMRLIAEKEARNEKLTSGQVAVKSAWYFMTRKQEKAHVPVN
jgi:hypothetical protein